MCRSQAEGGQRCYAHALEAYSKVRDRNALGHGTEVFQRSRDASRAAETIASDTPETRAQALGWVPFDDPADHPNTKSLHTARILLASSENGRALVDSWRTATNGPDRAALEAMWGKNQDAIDDYLNRVQEQGRELAAQNETFRRLANPTAWTHVRARAKALVDSFSKDWTAYAKFTGPGAVLIMNGLRSNGWAAGIQLGAGALALGVTAYLAYDETRHSGTPQGQAARLQGQQQRDRRERDEREIATVKAVYERDVRRGVVKPPAPSEERKRSFRRLVQDVASSLSPAA
jgi:hypothetical protein